MTEEEFKAKVADLEAEKAALKSKNSELIDREKAEKARADKAQRDAEEATENAHSANSTELEKAIKRAEKAEKAAKEADDRAADLQKSMRNSNADSAISKLIASANVDAADAKLLTKAIRASVEFSDDGQPMIEGKDVDSFGKEFFGQKGEGYRYVRAANNNGGGARGSDGSKAAPMTKDNFNLTDYARLQREDPQAALAVKQQLGLNY